MPRLYCPVALESGCALLLPTTAARHVQVLRLQPGDPLTLFSGDGGEFDAVVERMGRSDVSVVVGRHHAIEREPARAVHLVVGMPANDRMDWLIEKAAELGAASIQPLLAQRSVIKLQGDRAEKKQVHWHAVAVAACEQSGRNTIPRIEPVLTLSQWVSAQGSAAGPRLLLSLDAQAAPLRKAAGTQGPITLLSGPEGGLTGQEEELAASTGFLRATLGPRILRSETAPLAALAALTLGG